jgi:hypothetical protein
VGCGGVLAITSPKFGLSEAAPLDEAEGLPEAGGLSETELLCAHAIRAHVQSSISRHFATFMFSAAAPK